MKKITYTVSIDKLRVCLNASTDLYSNLKPLLFQRQGFGVDCKYIVDPRRGFGWIVNIIPTGA